MEQSEVKAVSYSERALIVGLITSDEFISGIAPIYSPRYVKEKQSHIVAGWCLDYFKKYGRAPDNHIHDLYEKHRANGLNPTIAGHIYYMLNNLAEQYGEESFNPQLILDEAKEAWERKGYELLADDIKDRLQTGDVAGAKKLQAEYKPFQLEINQKNSLQEALADNSLVMSFEDLENLDLPEVEMIIEGDIPIEEETITQISGPPGIGKTFTVLEMLRVAASGDTGLGGCIKSSGGYKSLYIDGELPEKKLRKVSRILDLANYPNLDVISKAKAERLELKPELNMMVAETREWFKDFIINNSYKLVALDNIFSLFPSLDLDSAQQWSPINSWLLSMRSKGVSFIVLHHTNKAKDQHGSIAKLFNLDASLIFEKAIPNDKITEDTACFKISVQKQRGTGLRLSDKKFIFRNKVWSIENIKIDESKVRKAIILKGLVDGIPQNKIAILAKCSEQNVGKIKKAEIVEGGMLVQVGDTLSLSKDGELCVDEYYRENYFDESKQE